MWDRTQFEGEMMPSTDSLYRHWKCVCWVIDMWRQANRPTLELRPLTEFGWKINAQDLLTFDWDSQWNIDSCQETCHSIAEGLQMQNRVWLSHLWLQEGGAKCSEGCDYTGCTNIASSQPTATPELMQTTIEEEEITTTNYSDHLNQKVDNIMEWAFGDEED